MPIYEFRCGACRKTFEKIVLSAEGATARARCPKCGAAGAERLVSRFATARREGAGSDDWGGGGGDDFDTDGMGDEGFGGGDDLDDGGGDSLDGFEGGDDAAGEDD